MFDEITMPSGKPPWDIAADYHYRRRGYTPGFFKENKLTRRVQDRLSRRKQARRRQFPYMASVRENENGSHICGASIISPEWALTAAHCDQGDLDSIIVGGVAINSREDNQVEHIPIQQVIKHPSWRNLPGDQDTGHDIALLKLARPSKAVPIQLNRNSALTNQGTPAMVMGWGYNPGSIEENVHTLMYRDDVKVSDPSVCKANYGLVTNNLCAGSGSEGKIDPTCSNDSGGPLVVDNGGIPTVVGVLSTGPEVCGDPTVPSNFTAVHHYADWICNITGNTANGC